MNRRTPGQKVYLEHDLGLVTLDGRLAVPLLPPTNVQLFLLPVIRYLATQVFAAMEGSLSFGMLFGYLGMLYVGALVVPGVGFTGRLMIQVPSTLLDWAHAPAYGVLAWLVVQGLRRRNWPSLFAIPAGSGASLVFGLWTEVWQGSVPGRFSSMDDLAIDTVGILCAALALSLHEGVLTGKSPASSDVEVLNEGRAK